MRINEITICGYIGRLSLNHHNKLLKLTFEAAIQLIIGSNGSGKSSLIFLLMLGVPKGSDFEKDGYVTIRLNHHEKEYRLHMSYKTQAGLYSLKELRGEEWIELNDSKGVTAQKELIALHFGMTSPIQNLISGKENLVGMTPARRRFWCMSASRADFDYAIDVFQRVKGCHRDLTGAIKIAKEQLTQERTNLLREEDVQAMQDKQRALQNDMTTLLKNTPMTRVSKTLLHQKLDECLTQLQKTSAGKIARISPPEGVTSEDALSQQITSLAALMQSNQERSERIYQLWSELSNNLKTITDVGIENTSDLNNRKTQLDQEIASLKASVKHRLKVASAQHALSRYDQLKQDLLLAIYALPGNPDERFTPAKLRACAQQIEDLSRAINHQDLMRANAQTQIEFNEKLVQEHKTSCPRCDHEFIYGYNPQDHADLVEKRTNAIAEKQRLQVLQRAEREELVVLEDYRDKFVEMRSQMAKFGFVGGADALITGSENFVAYPVSTVVVVNEIEDDLRAMARAEELSITLSEVNASLMVLGKLNANDLGHYQAQLAAYSKEMEVLTESITQGKERLQRLKSFKHYAETLARKNALSQQRFKELEQTYEALAQSLLHDAVDEMRAAVSSELAYVDNQLLKNKMAVAGIETLEREIAKNVEQEKLYKVIVEELSPTTGLIAEGMVGFINDFIETMNALIEKIWSYPLQLKPIKLNPDDFDLDYLFPFNAGEEMTPRNDVSEGSASMVEIFNLAFMITCLRGMDMLDIPLYLDEFGTKFDPVHRINSSHAIKTIIEELPFTQLFMISHYQANYGGYANAQTTVLCDKNIE